MGVGAKLSLAFALTATLTGAAAVGVPETGRSGLWLFEQPWAPASNEPGRQRLSCSQCHLAGGRGPSPRHSHNNTALVIFAFEGGRRHAVVNNRGTPVFRIRYEPRQFRYPDGETVTLHAPSYDLADAQWRHAILSPRIAPSLRDGSPCIVAAGPCGYRHATADVRDQIAAAFQHEMGVEITEAHRPGFSQVNDQDVRALETHMRAFAIAPPHRSAHQDEAARRTGCLSCHSPDPAARERLYDMGAQLADIGGEAMREHRLWVAPNLDRIRLRALRSPRSGYLHDGRALNVEEAVLWHGGAAQASRDVFVASERGDREAILSLFDSRGS